MPTPFNFQWYRGDKPKDKAWWQAVKVKAAQEGYSVNQLLIEFLDAWLRGRIGKGPVK